MSEILHSAGAPFPWDYADPQDSGNPRDPVDRVLRTDPPNSANPPDPADKMATVILSIN